jgi:uncharacterized protein (TIGR02145 family)
MKSKIYPIIAIVFGLFPNAFSQKAVMELTFTANYSGQWVPADSIFIENLTQGGDTILYSPDTVLVLDYFVTGADEPINSFLNGFTVTQNYPNPFRDKTTFRVYLPGADQLQIRVCNLLGNTVACFENTLESGIHTFNFYNGIDRNYILSASAGGTVKSIKMAGLTNSGGKSCSLNYAGKEETSYGYKSQKSVNIFGFAPGDSLRFICFANTTSFIAGSDVKGDIPQSDITYTFEILEGIPCTGVPEVVYEGKTYGTLQIGEQCWFRENLNAGFKIDIWIDQSNNGLMEKYCYNNNEVMCENYGGLYQWNEMMQYSLIEDLQGICPDGWHIPTDDEYTALTDYLGGASIAGGKLKKTGMEYWYSPNTGATNEVGFTALPSGAGFNGSFQYLGQGCVLWSSTQPSFNNAWYRAVYYNQTIVDRSSTATNTGFSVRCLKD